MFGVSIELGGNWLSWSLFTYVVVVPFPRRMEARIVLKSLHMIHIKWLVSKLNTGEEKSNHNNSNDPSVFVAALYQSSIFDSRCLVTLRYGAVFKRGLTCPRLISFLLLVSCSFWRKEGIQIETDSSFLCDNAWSSCWGEVETHCLLLSRRGNFMQRSFCVQG